MSPKQAANFQCNILKTILQLEATFFELAEEEERNTLVVCDRGTMDPSACKNEYISSASGSRVLNLVPNLAGFLHSML